MSKKQSKKQNKKPYFQDKYHVRHVEKCCGSCRYYDFDQDRDEYCGHPEVKECAEYNRYFVNAGYVCDLWEE